jgi:hypothetical protein
MADQQQAQAAEELERAHRLAFDPTKPAHYSNIFYVSGTAADMRIAFGTLRTVSAASNVLTVDKFDVSVTLPHSVAQQLSDMILALLAQAKANVPVGNA